MASILLNDISPERRELLNKNFRNAGHEVWTASHLNEIIAILHDVSIDVMILDLNGNDLDELVQFGEHWKGISKLFHADCADIFQDARCSMAEQCLCKEADGANVMEAVIQVLKKRQIDQVNSTDMV